MAVQTHIQCFVLWILLGIGVSQLTFNNETVCQGEVSELTASGDSDFRYTRLKNRYTNCTYIQGSLQIVFLENADATKKFDLSFLRTIKEVTGYVLILSVFADYVPLENLQIIRGRSLYHNKYSLYVALNSHATVEPGLQELRFTALSEILKGKVFFKNNNKLCYENTIIWSDINPRESPPVEFHFDSIHEKRQCGECHDSCYQQSKQTKACWGAGPDMCQKLSQGEVCHGSCDGRCYGKLPNQCCHPQCAAGCSGPKKTDCLSCRNFNDLGACVEFCPLQEIYDSQKFIKIPNPNARFTYGALCVKECPPGMLNEDGMCVVQCSEGKIEDTNSVCQQCKGPCPRECLGTGPDTFLTSEDLERFTDCTRIRGTLKILKHSFIGDVHNNIPPLHPDNLTVFEYVREITGNLIIQSDDKDFKNLSCFKSLEYIYGRETNSDISFSIIMTQLESLELVNLKHIRRGNVMIAGNYKLCYIDSINWYTKILSPTSQQKVTIVQNGNATVCKAEGRVCDPECSSDGCWGPGSEKCLSCKRYRIEEKNICIKTCAHIDLHYEGDNLICKPCHQECRNNCTGPEPSECDSCNHVSIIDSTNHTICLAACPDIMYPDKNSVCQKCHKNCANGCTGPMNYVGKNGCNSCEVGYRQQETSTTIECMPIDTDNCPDGHHMTPVKFDIKNHPLAGKRICQPCHRLCETCTGSGVFYCNRCQYFFQQDACVEHCQTMSYGNNATKTCEVCHNECRSGCYGPASSDCLACKNFKIYTNEEATKFNCTLECPIEVPFLVDDIYSTESTSSRTVCADATHPDVKARQTKNADDEKKKMAIIVGPSIAGVVVLGLLILCIAWCCQRQAKAKEKTAKLTARMTGCDEEVPLTPTDAKPDLAQLKLIKENDLRRGGIIGSGAFGTVYKGFWIPEGANVKIPVAIKVLQEGTSPNQNKELLEEARVMTSVDHPCCVRILAVCMTAQMMLITQLMPLGCLLDYVRKNKEHIGSKVLLNWCTQIAKGMVYLEERGIVHRDLAARNVLLHNTMNTQQVKITDFGLAKLLDYDEEVYQAAGGKMPIKWLALECIQHRIFTHKSDVWSYGVTVWELMTYGLKPYDSIRARDVPDLLEKGERLPQPHCCTIDVYMIMIKCWMLDAESRPSFLELQEEFGKMARDPGRYLVIQGDVLKRLSGVSNGVDSDENTHDSNETNFQGDKLLRLPSAEIDKIDLVRSLSVANDGGPEEVMEADDYLQPNSDDSVDNNNGQAKALLLPRSPGASNFDNKMGPGKPIRDKRYQHLNSAVQAQEQRTNRGRGDSINSRYSSDPVKFLKDKGDFDLVPEDIELGFMYSDSSSSKVPLNLPVDEDDYLQPKSHNPAAYMDLSDKGYYQNERDVFYEEDEDGLEEDEVIKPLTNGVENPEYFDTPRQNGFGGGLKSFKPNPKPRKIDYYNDLNQVSPVEKKQLILRVNSKEGGHETSI